MKIVEIDATVVQATNQDATAFDSSQEALLVRVVTDDGFVGIGEGAASPAALKTLIDTPTSWVWNQGIKDILVGQDPTDPAALWRLMFDATWWSGRVGLGHVAMAAVDMAIWDLAGQIKGVPVWKLLGELRPEPLKAYITVYEGGQASLRDTIDGTLRVIDTARDLGYTAAKIEALRDTAADEAEVIELVRSVRRSVGDDFDLLCDVGYRWTDADVAIACVKQLDEFGLLLLETPLLPEDLSGYRRLVESVTTPIAGAEILSSFSECTTLMDVGAVDIIQPSTPRLGVTETHRLARAARDRGRRVVTHGWVSTAVALSASVHIAAVNSCIPLIEYAPPSVYPDSSLRLDLVLPEPVVKDGAFVVPEEPGFGCHLNQEAFARYRVA